MTKTADAIKLVLADDHELFRDGFRVMANKEPEIDVIGEAADGEALLSMVARLQPDVVITDIKMPVLDGVQVMLRMKQEFPDIGVIALTNYEEENLIVEMLEAGARGYLLKTAHKREIVEAIKTVFKGKTYYCHTTSPKLANLIANSSFNPYRKKKKITFNERELQIIRLVCDGLSNKEIAARLFLSRRTIETHRENIMDKIDENNTAALVVYAIKHGLYQI